MRPFDRHVKQPIIFRFIQRHVSVRGNVAIITDRCVKLLDVLLKILWPQTLSISHTFENPAFS